MATVLRPSFVSPKPVDDAFWVGRSVGAPNYLLALTPVYTLRPPFYAPRPYDEANWQINFVNSTLILLTPTSLVYLPRSPVIIPRSSDDTFWQGTSAASAFALLRSTSTVSPFTNNLWKFVTDDSNVWLGQPTSSKLLEPILTAGGQVKPFHWLFASDDSSSWQGQFNKNFNVVNLAKPFVNAPWSFRQDDFIGWLAGPVASAVLSHLLTVGGQVKPFRWNFTLDDPPTWQIIPNKDFPLNSLPAPVPFFGKPWKFNLDDSANWQLFYGKNTNLVTANNPFFNPLWKFGVDDASPWAGAAPRSLVLPLFGSKPFEKLWRWDYLIDEPLWLGKPVSSNTLVPNLTASGQVKPFRWNFTLNDASDWARQLVRSVTLTILTIGGQAPTKRWQWDDIPDSLWGRAPFGFPQIPVVPPTSPLEVDPRFITAPNAPVPSNAGSSRITVTSGDAFAPRLFVTTPRVTGMPYGNDLSVIDPTIEQVTVTFNFAPWLLPGVTITSVLSIVAAVSTESLVQDPNPSGIIFGSPQISASPTTGAASTAILQQFADCQPDVIYLLTCLVATSDNQKLNLATHLPCAILN